MSADRAAAGRPLSEDGEWLRARQYANDANLATRQAIYSYQRPAIDLVGAVLDAAAVKAHELVADVGCGNGRYLERLAGTGHRRLIGLDLSTGMASAAADRLGAKPLSSPTSPPCRCPRRAATAPWRCTCSTTSPTGPGRSPSSVG